jgi:hypothetical protein
MVPDCKHWSTWFANAWLHRHSRSQNVDNSVSVVLVWKCQIVTKCSPQIDECVILRKLTPWILVNMTHSLLHRWVTNNSLRIKIMWVMVLESDHSPQYPRPFQFQLNLTRKHVNNACHIAQNAEYLWLRAYSLLVILLESGFVSYAMHNVHIGPTN